MSFGGNGRARIFFKQHGWADDGGKIESKYTSRVADLYRKLLLKEVAKSMTSSISASPPLPDSPTALVSSVKDFPEYKDTSSTVEDKFLEQPKAPLSGPSRPPPSSAVKKTSVFGAKKMSGGKSGGGLGVKKLTAKPNENLYDQKPSELPIVTPVATSSVTDSAPPRTSRFTYAEEQSMTNYDGQSSSSHVPAPSTSMDLFSEFGLPGNRKSGGSSRPRPQIEETGEAQWKFSSAKSISSSQFFDEDKKIVDADGQMRLQKFATNFAPPVTQQPVKSFVPSTPPVLKNGDQCQPPSLMSQIYPGVLTPSIGAYAYQPGVPAPASVGSAPVHPPPVPNVMLPGSSTAPTAPPRTPRSFMPDTTPALPQQPGLVPPVQLQSPTVSSQVQTVTAPPAPPPTVQNVDTTNVAAELRPANGTLTRLYKETSEALGGARANPSKCREIDDNSRKIGSLFAKLNSGDLSSNATTKLVQLCQALDSGNYSAAIQIQVGLTRSYWDECRFWLAALKRMIIKKQSMG